MNIVGCFFLVFTIGVVSIAFNKQFLADDSLKNGEPCLISTPTGVVAADRCYGHSKK